MQVYKVYIVVINAKCYNIVPNVNNLIKNGSMIKVLIKLLILYKFEYKRGEQNNKRVKILIIWSIFGNIRIVEWFFIWILLFEVNKILHIINFIKSNYF